MFRELYDFDVSHALLDGTKPRQKAAAELANFVLREDKQRALLIIYYAGHGHGTNVGPGDMRLEGYVVSGPTKLVKSPTDKIVQ